MGSPSASSGLGAARFRAAPLFHAAWLFALGIFVAHCFWCPPATLIISLVLLFAFSGIALRHAPRLLLPPLVLAWILLGAWCAEMEPQPALAPQLLAYSDGLLREVEGTVTRAGPVRSEQDQDAGSGASEAPAERVDLRIASIERVTDTEDHQVPVDGTVRLIIRWPEVLSPIASAAGTALASSHACFRRRSIATQASGIARIIYWTRARPLPLLFPCNASACGRPLLTCQSDVFCPRRSRPQVPGYLHFLQPWRIFHTRCASAPMTPSC